MEQNVSRILHEYFNFELHEITRLEGQLAHTQNPIYIQAALVRYTIQLEAYRSMNTWINELPKEKRQIVREDIYNLMRFCDNTLLERCGAAYGFEEDYDE
jgi:hypothetical protein